MMDIEEIRRDIAAFADTEEDVIVDHGVAVFQRNRVTYECKLTESPSGVDVEYNGARLPYRKFLGEELGRLKILAEAIRQKRKDVAPYVDTRGVITTSVNKSIGPDSALGLLWNECQSRPLGETKLTFLTADAGSGKTALLRRLTRRFADAYLAGRSDALLLHIDTQGRSFVRLEEAVARDLGQLRIAGLYYSGVVRLIRRGLLAFAVDGFDELLAEVGFGEAYSGLGAFLRQLDGTGTVIASARSAYFEIENYAAQTRLLASLPGIQVSVQQMKLLPWERRETVQMFTEYQSAEGSVLPEPGGLYDELSERVGLDHPVLHRPFLVYQMASLLTSSTESPTQLASTLGSRLQVVPNVIRALLRREVGEKWRDRSGLPYLSLEQHIALLSLIADEMWTQGKNSLSVDVVQLLAEALMDEYEIAPDRRAQVAERVKAHALLVPSGGVPNELTFDHEEFLNFFLASRLANLLRRSDDFGLRRFCELRLIPRSVATWGACGEDWNEGDGSSFVERLSRMTKAELRSTYLKQNAGLIAAQLAQRFGDSPAARFVFDSMYFETDAWKESTLNHAIFRRCNFVNVDISGVRWSACEFADCTVDGLTLSPASFLGDCLFSGTTFVLGVLLRRDGDTEELRTYVPEQCKSLLSQAGARFEGPPDQQELPFSPVPVERRKAVDSFFRIFSRNSGATDEVMKMKLGKRFAVFSAQVLPALLECGVVRPTSYRGRGQQSRYELGYPLDMILKAEDPSAPVPANLREFWDRMRSR